MKIHAAFCCGFAGLRCDREREAAEGGQASRGTGRLRRDGEAVAELGSLWIGERAVEGRPFGDHGDLVLGERVDGFRVIVRDDPGWHVLHQILTVCKARLAFFRCQVRVEGLVEQRPAEGPDRAHEAVAGLRLAAQRLQREGVLLLVGLSELRSVNLVKLLPGRRRLVEAGVLEHALVVEKQAGIVVERKTVDLSAPAAERVKEQREEPLQVQIGVGDRRVADELVGRHDPAVLRELPDPYEVDQRDRQIPLRVEVEHLLLAGVLIGHDLVVDLDAGLLLELRQELDDRPIARTIEKNDVELRAFVRGGRLCDVPFRRRDGRRGDHRRTCGECERAERRQEPFSHSRSSHILKTERGSSVGSGPLQFDEGLAISGNVGGEIRERARRFLQPDWLGDDRTSVDLPAARNLRADGWTSPILRVSLILIPRRREPATGRAHRHEYAGHRTRCCTPNKRSAHSHSPSAFLVAGLDLWSTSARVSLKSDKGR